MSHSPAILSFLAFAAAAFTASGVEVVDLTAAARKKSGITATASSVQGSFNAQKAFDGDATSSSSRYLWCGEKLILMYVFFSTI